MPPDAFLDACSVIRLVLSADQQGHQPATFLDNLGVRLVLCWAVVGELRNARRRFVKLDRQEGHLAGRTWRLVREFMDRAEPGYPPIDSIPIADKAIALGLPSDDAAIFSEAANVCALRSVPGEFVTCDSDYEALTGRLTDLARHLLGVSLAVCYVSPDEVKHHLVTLPRT